MLITVPYQSGFVLNATVDRAQALGISRAVIGAACKETAKREVAEFAETCRARLVSRSAGRLAEYRIKEEIARDPANAAESELAMIDREAAARGIDRGALLADISAKAAAYRQFALLIGALQAEAGAAIAAIPDDDAEIESQVETVLGDAKVQADTALAEARATLEEIADSVPE